jgi:hypothetical protein
MILPVYLPSCSSFCWEKPWKKVAEVQGHYRTTNPDGFPYVHLLKCLAGHQLISTSRVVSTCFSWLISMNMHEIKQRKLSCFNQPVSAEHFAGWMLRIGPAIRDVGVNELLGVAGGNFDFLCPFVAVRWPHFQGVCLQKLPAIQQKNRLIAIDIPICSSLVDHDISLFAG